MPANRRRRRAQGGGHPGCCWPAPDKVSIKQTNGRPPPIATSWRRDVVRKFVAQ